MYWLERYRKNKKGMQVKYHNGTTNGICASSQFRSQVTLFEETDKTKGSGRRGKKPLCAQEESVFGKGEVCVRD